MALWVTVDGGLYLLVEQFIAGISLNQVLRDRNIITTLFRVEVLVGGGVVLQVFTSPHQAGEWRSSDSQLPYIMTGRRSHKKVSTLQHAYLGMQLQDWDLKQARFFRILSFSYCRVRNFEVEKVCCLFSFESRESSC